MSDKSKKTALQRKYPKVMRGVSRDTEVSLLDGINRFTRTDEVR